MNGYKKIKCMRKGEDDEIIHEIQSIIFLFIIKKINFI
jgi:hypothetical protein